MADEFWTQVEQQLTELRTAKTADEVLSILSQARNPYGADHSNSGEGFFAGSAMDNGVDEALSQAGWKYVWSREYYWWCMVAPNGDQITYVEGDIYKGNKRA